MTDVHMASIERYSKWEDEPDINELRTAYGLIESNASEAISRLTALADRSSAMSMVYLAEVIESQSNDKYSTVAEQWYSRAAELGSPLASYKLARRLLSRGKIIEARAQLERSAAQSYPPSLRLLAKLLLRGEGGKRDPSRAQSLLEDAVHGGSVFAERDLAYAFIAGRFGRPKPLRGFHLLIRASLRLILILKNGADDERLR